MKTNEIRTAAIAKIAKQMSRTAPAGFDVEPVAIEFFDDLTAATADMILTRAVRNPLDYAATACNQLGIPCRDAANIARAVMIQLDRRGRASADYREGVLHALRMTPDETGALRWDASGNVVPTDLLEDYSIAHDAEAQAAARERDLVAAVERYRNQRLSDEDRAEMNAAFGPGVSVVNVLTGETVHRTN